MKSTKKTYGVHGLMEWHANISCGKAVMTVPFSGGSLSGYGVSPATFTTEHPFTQMVIENSGYFKSGKITLIRETEGSGKYDKMVVDGGQRPSTATAGEKAEGPLAPADGQRPSTATAGTGADAPGTGAGVETTGTGAGVEALGQVAEEDEEEKAAGGLYEKAEAAGKAVVEVSDIDDARDYLVEEFGVDRKTLRSNASVMKAAAERNIVFKGLE